MMPTQLPQLVLVCCLALAVCAQAVAGEPAIQREIATERWAFQRDGRDWKLVTRQVGKQASSHRYVLEGDSADLWNEVISTDHYPANTSADQHALAFVDELQGRCHRLKVAHTSNGPNSIILEWEGDCRISGKQQEIRRIDVGPDGFDHLAYGAKAKFMTPEKQQTWRAILRTARLKDTKFSSNRGE